MRSHPISVAEDYWGVRHGSLAGIEPTHATPLCSLCGAELVDDLGHDARVCPTHGRQIRYTVRGADGHHYPADQRQAYVHAPHPEAIELLREGWSLRHVVDRTGISRSVLGRWLQSMSLGEM